MTKMHAFPSPYLAVRLSVCNCFSKGELTFIIYFVEENYLLLECEVMSFRLGDICRTCYFQNHSRKVPKFMERLQYCMKICLRFVLVCSICLYICSLSYGTLHLSDSVARSVSAIGEWRMGWQRSSYNWIRRACLLERRRKATINFLE